jgi:hypothetical protein
VVFSYFSHIVSEVFAPIFIISSDFSTRFFKDYIYLHDAQVLKEEYYNTNICDHLT